MTVYGRGEERPVVLEGHNAYVVAGGGSLRVLTLDGHLVTSTWEHLRQFNVLLDALPNIHLCVNQVDPQDDEGDRFYVRLAAEMLIGMPKPCLLQAFDAADVTAMFEMGVAIRGSAEALADKPVFAVIANAEPPLNISQHVAELLIAAFQADLPCHLGNYNMMGITAPATVAGAVVQINAVQLVALILSQIVRSGVAFIYTAFSGDGNMRTLAPLTSSPRSLRQQRLAARVGHFYGLPVYGVAVTDANMPDSQAACETAVGMMLALEAGCNLIQGPTSMMDSMMLSSFAQAVIDNDIVGYVLASRLEPEISAETLALEAMHWKQCTRWSQTHGWKTSNSPAILTPSTTCGTTCGSRLRSPATTSPRAREQAANQFWSEPPLWPAISSTITNQNRFRLRWQTKSARSQRMEHNRGNVAGK
jgi:trimethylamine--corrinoid protein Co-methyltransferase